MKKIILIVFGLVAGLLVTILADHLINWYLIKTAYFKTEVPNITYVYDTVEYQNSVKISSQGLRNRQVPIPKPKGTYRILALGDSFTHGLGVSDSQTWPQLLENSLKVNNQKLQVINAGQPGFGTIEEVKTCQIYAGNLQADAIILGFYSTNDLYQNAAWDKSNSLIGKLTENLFPALSLIASPFNVVRNPQIKPGQILKERDNWKSRAKSWTQAHYLEFSRLDLVTKEAFINGKLNPFVVITPSVEPQFLSKMLDPVNLEDAINATSKLFRKLKSCTKDRPVFVLFLPSMEITSQKYLNQRRNFGYDLNEKLLKLDIDNPLAQISKRYSFTYISLLENFRKDGCPNCFYKLDTHLTKQGNIRVANYLRKELGGKLK